MTDAPAAGRGHGGSVGTVRLVRRNLLRHPLRAAITFVFSLLALFLFVFLRSAVTTLDSAAKAAATNRVMVQSAVSLFVYMPEGYRTRIAAVEGVESVESWNWFGGWYQDRRNFFAQFAANLDVLLRQYPEIVVPEEQKRELLSDRRGCLVGRGIAEKFGWKVGTRIPILTSIYALDRGAWEFDVRAIYTSTRPNIDEQTMFFHWDYLQEMRKKIHAAGYRAGDQDVGIFVVKVKDGHRPEEVIEEIERLYENGPQRVRVQTEAAFQAQFVSMYGNVPTLLTWIGGAILFAIFFSVLNASQMAARERAKDVGVLKALGFSDAFSARLLLVESMAVVGTGGLVGVVLGALSENVFRRLFGFVLAHYHVDPWTLAAGAALAIAIGFVGGLLPALRLYRLKTVDVLREEA